MIEFKDRFKQLRLENKLTQQQISNILFLNKSSISRYEKGSQIPELDLLQKIANYFNVSTDYLLGRTNQRNLINDYEVKNHNKKTIIEGTKILSDEEAEDLLRLVERLFPDKFKGISNLNKKSK